MKLWELLVAGFVIPVFWHGWKWQFRRMGIKMAGDSVVLAVQTVVTGMRETFKQLKKGDDSHGQM